MARYKRNPVRNPDESYNFTLKYVANIGRVPVLYAPTTQPPTVVCKMEAQLKYLHIAYTVFANSYSQSVFINKISASELSQKFIKSAFLVGLAGLP